MEAYRLQTGSMTGLTIPLQMKHLNPRGAGHVPPVASGSPWLRLCFRVPKAMLMASMDKTSY